MRNPLNNLLDVVSFCLIKFKQIEIIKEVQEIAGRCVWTCLMCGIRLDAHQLQWILWVVKSWTWKSGMNMNQLVGLNCLQPNLRKMSIRFCFLCEKAIWGGFLQGFSIIFINNYSTKKKIFSKNLKQPTSHFRGLKNRLCRCKFLIKMFKKF